MYPTKQRSLRPFMAHPFFDDPFMRPFFTSSVDGKWSTPPAVNIREGEEAFLIEFAAPGFGKNDFSVKIEKDQIVINGTHTASETTASPKFSRREFNYGSFSRSFTLPENVDTDRISATYVNGILAVNVPKKMEQKNTAERVISVQ
jgi:HSP20 family protein